MIGTMKYCFPKMHIGQTFESLEAATMEMADQVYNVGCQGMENIMKWIRTSNGQVRLNCQSCLASIVFMEQSEGTLCVKSVNNIHVHVLNMMSGEEARFAQLVGELMISPSTNESAESQAAKYEQPQQLIPQEPVDITKQFIQYVKNGWHIVMEEYSYNNLSYPSIAIFSTFKRHNTLNYFSDCVGIYMLPQLLPMDEKIPSLTYKVCLLVSFDYKMAPIITAVGLISSSSTACCYKMFSCFVRFAEKKVDSIVINDDPALLNVLKLKSQLDERRQVILLDTELVKRRAAQLTVNHPKSKDIEDIVSKLVREREQEKGQLLIKRLYTIHEKCSISPLLSYLQTNAGRIYVWLMPKVFIGIHFSALDFIEGPTIKNLMASSNLSEFLQKFQKQDDSYISSRPVMYNTPVEEAFDDPKLKVVRLSLQAAAFEQFMRVYLKAVTSAEPTSDSLIGQSALSQKNMKCPCGFVLQTGLPCLHMLKVARKIPVMPYCELISKRWKRFEYLMMQKEVEVLDELF